MLKVLAELFQRRTRDSDFVARLGGEAFMMILPDSPGGDAFTVTDKLREIVEQANLHYRETAVPVTVSCGITELAEGDDPAHCINEPMKRSTGPNMKGATSAS